MVILDGKATSDKIKLEIAQMVKDRVEKLGGDFVKAQNYYAKRCEKTFFEELDEEVEEEKTQGYRIEVSHHIDALYVGDDALRIEMHKVINKVKSRDQQNK